MKPNHLFMSLPALAVAAALALSATPLASAAVTEPGSGQATVTTAPAGEVFKVTKKAPKAKKLSKKQDRDRDGMADAWEKKYKLNPKEKGDANTDADKDGLSNLWEFRLGTNPKRADTDKDGLPDGWEYQYGLNPTSAKGEHGKDGDFDGDRYTNASEHKAGSNPSKKDSIAFRAPTGVVFHKAICKKNSDGNWVLTPQFKVTGGRYLNLGNAETYYARKPSNRNWDNVQPQETRYINAVDETYDPGVHPSRQYRWDPVTQSTDYSSYTNEWQTSTFQYVQFVAPVTKKGNYYPYKKKRTIVREFTVTWRC